jgi:hypothetical protein
MPPAGSGSNDNAEGDHPERMTTPIDVTHIL